MLNVIELDIEERESLNGEKILAIKDQINDKIHELFELPP